jgi:hypothetical protein
MTNLTPNSTSAPEPRPNLRGQMLPGIAGICLYMMVVALTGVFGAVRGAFPPMVALPVCTLLVVGIFGLLRLRRWGWAMVTAGSLLISLMYGWMARHMALPRLWVMAGLDLCMFLYLVRAQVRDRLR